MVNPRIIQWHNDAFQIEFVVNTDGVICLSRMSPPGAEPQNSASPHFDSSEIPLISVKLAGEGNGSIKSARSLIGSCISTRLKYEHHKIERHGQTEVFSVVCSDKDAAVEITARFTVYNNIPVLRSEATVRNLSDNVDVVVTQISSLTVGGMTTSSAKWFDDYTLMYATNTWFREAQWQERTLPDLGIDNNGIVELEQEGHEGSLATFSLSARGCCSTSAHLPMGVLKNKTNEDTWLWQVEANGSWRWEIGDWRDSIYLAAGGPTGTDHSWKQLLRPGGAFTSVPVACCRVRGDVEEAFAALTDYRRHMRRPHDDMERVPIIFNDYMNCLMGDPDEQKIEALLDPVAELGAEYFVIDAGWYADDSNWWDDVGLWEPSPKRFPSGFKSLLDKIRARGLVPGLWLEPEVVGVRSEVATRLPKEAFFLENGHRITEKGRFMLDFRHPDVIPWMDQVVQNLVVNYGAGFFKFDHNIEVMQGTDVDGPSTTGTAHLQHQRAYLGWVRSLLDRYPGLVIESCASGAQRLDYATLAVHSIQSTSDQQDPALYAAIAAALPSALTPEQSGTWAYPQPEWDDELNALTVVNSLLGRVYLSGRVDRLSSGQLGLIKEGMEIYKQIRHDVREANATWPLGFPKWHDDWVALGLVSQDKKKLYVAIWRRGGPTKMGMPIKWSNSHQRSELNLLYPANLKTEFTWSSTTGMLMVELPNTACARLFRIEELSS